MAPRTLRPPAAPAKRLSLADVTTKAKNLPSRVLLHGVPGVGKTSLAAHAPAPVFIMSKLETGIESLRDAKLIPEGVGSFPECKTWQQLLETIDVLEKEEHLFKTAVLDVANGAERLCFEHICARDYADRMAAFMAYGNGPKSAVSDWRQMLAAFDRLREIKRMTVIFIAHTQVKNFRNPEGPDYDRFIPELSQDIWGVTHGWADMVLFANYNTTVSKDHGNSGKGKAKGGEQRLLYTTRTAAWDAKNRDNLPEIIPMGDSGNEAWNNFYKEICEAKKG
jgi:hypothetical protein